MNTCDVPGCGMPAGDLTTGKEVDVQGLGRPAIAKLAVCSRHTNWPHSKDAEDFIAGRFITGRPADAEAFQRYKGR